MQQRSLPLFEELSEREAPEPSPPAAQRRRRPKPAAPRRAALSRQPHDIKPISALIIENASQIRTLALQLFGIDLRDWSVSCDLRGMAAGQVVMQQRRIRFNPHIAAAQPDAFLQTTIAHEIAHVVCHQLHGRAARPHGPEWRRICVALGGSGERCHHFSTTPARRVSRYQYACGCRTWAITGVRVRRMRRGMRYECRDCGQQLRPLGGGRQ
jgi:SprT protein